jgi:hypothetical protein
VRPEEEGGGGEALFAIRNTRRCANERGEVQTPLLVAALNPNSCGSISDFSVGSSWLSVQSLPTAFRHQRRLVPTPSPCRIDTKGEHHHASTLPERPKTPHSQPLQTVGGGNSCHCKASASDPGSWLRMSAFMRLRSPNTHLIRAMLLRTLRMRRGFGICRLQRSQQAGASAAVSAHAED